MVTSILIRQTRITERAVWQASLGTVLPKIRKLLESQAGFVSLQYLWGADEPGRIAQITTWKSEGDCRRYIREGGAATVATIEDAAVPTAAYPNGNWVRQNFSAADV
jgi:heme-degrading monooxygenase HmoA